MIKHSFLGGQYTPEMGGQHTPDWHGHFKPESHGQYDRIFQTRDAGGAGINYTPDATNDKFGVIINSNYSAILQGVIGSTIISAPAGGLTAKTSYTTYVNQLSFGQLAGVRDGILKRTTLTADRTWTLPDQSGTIAMLTDIPSSTVSQSITDGVTTTSPSEDAVFDALSLKLDQNGDTVLGILGYSVDQSGSYTARSLVDKGYVDSRTTTNISEGTNLYFTNARVITAPLTGYVSGAGTVNASDTILQAIQKLNGNTALLTGAVVYQGTWNASTNSPALASGVGTKGHLYKVSVAGTTTIDGQSQWEVGDAIVFNGTTYDRIDGGTTEVTTVHGRVGAVVGAASDYAGVAMIGITSINGLVIVPNTGVITTGTWNGTAIVDTYIASAATWNAKLDGSGTTNYISKWNAGALTSSQIQDNGSTLSIGVAPASQYNFYVRGLSTNYMLVGENIKVTSGSNAVGVFGSSGGGGSTQSNIGVIGSSANNTLLNVGVQGTTSGASAVNVGGHFNATGATNNYSLKLTDGTQAAGKFLKSVTAGGEANWSIITESDITGFGSYLPLAGGSLSGALNEKAGADIASATTTDIGAATGNYVNITGTTTITGLGTVQAGTRRVVKFTGALTLTHNATSLILLGGVNITTVAGDTATFISLGSGNWICTSYNKNATMATTAYVDSAVASNAEWTAASATWVSTSSFTVTDNATNQALFAAGKPLKYKVNSVGTYRYGRVSSYTTGTVVISGYPLTASIEEMNAGVTSKLVFETYFIPGGFAGTTSTTKLADMIGMTKYWKGTKAHLVTMDATIKTAETGATKPVINFYKNGNAILSTGLTLTSAATRYNSGILIETAVGTHYDFTPNDSPEIGVTTVGTNGTALDLSIEFTYVVE